MCRACACLWPRARWAVAEEGGGEVQPSPVEGGTLMTLIFMRFGHLVKSSDMATTYYNG
uniref:Uncharacterized protein n=1 Tax=Oryza brachyantha TaxID=4533 RepID=J3M223_ORYBR